MKKKVWYAKSRVVVCGVREGRIVSDGQGAQHFKNLADAHHAFPDLDPDNSTKRFTAATGDPEKGEMRFDTHQAHALYTY